MMEHDPSQSGYIRSFHSLPEKLEDNIQTSSQQTQPETSSQVATPKADLAPSQDAGAQSRSLLGLFDHPQTADSTLWTTRPTEVPSIFGFTAAPRLYQEPQNSFQPQSLEPQSLEPEHTHTNMSAMTATPFDPRMEMDISRSSFAWPGMDHNADFMGSSYISMGPGSDAGLTTSSIDSRSITSSPPHPTLTAEQRELKRQSDMARRGSKASLRARKAMSSYRASQSPPLSMNEFPSTSNMPIYTTTQTPLSLIAEPVTTIPGVSTYVPAYSTSSPPLPDHQPTTMFPTPYEYMGMGYTPEYSSPPHQPHNHALSSQYRPSPASDPTGMLYSNSPLVPVGIVPAMGSNAMVSDPSHVRVVQTRPKPQCWEHGCNGRQFSTFSNLLRHQREKSGQATKSSCPNCGAEFTRTTARNGHLLHDKCKQRKNST